MSYLGGQFKNCIKAEAGSSAAVGGSRAPAWTSVYTAPSTKTSYLIELDIACTGNTGVQVSVRIVDSSSSVTAHLIKNAPVPQGSSLKVIDGQKIVLEPGDLIEVKCETENESVDVIASLVEDVN